MERLTERDKNGVAVLRADRITGTLQDNPVARLAAYEDTGITPAEIAALKAERDAAVRDLEKLMPISYFDDRCEFCKKDEGYKCPLLRGGDCRPVWRGPQKEASGP